MGFTLMMMMMNNSGCIHGSYASRLFQPALVAFNSHDPNPNPNPNNKMDRLRITNGAPPRASSYVASFAALAMLTRNVANDVVTVAKELRTIADELVPREYQNYYLNELQTLLRAINTDFTIVIDEFPPRSNSHNRLYDAARSYLATKSNSPSVRRLNVSKTNGACVVKVDEGQEIVDYFDGIQVRWRPVTKGDRRYEMTFDTRYKDTILDSYLPHIVEATETTETDDDGIRLHVIDGAYDERKILVVDRPMTFGTLAIDTGLKKAMTEDLNGFKNGQEYHRRIGKAWNRGFLLYGPPGTGKSSLIASMANYLNYDIYKVELAEVGSDSRLKNIVLGVPRKSMLVFEDIEDDTDGRLSRAADLVDRLRSWSGEERIFVFVTDRDDPEMLRPGRIDVRVRMGYCKFSAFKQLALNYLEIEDHKLFRRIEKLLEKTDVTPAEAAGELMKNRRDVTACLEGFIWFLKDKASS